MPSLVMRAPAGSLLEQTSRLVVQRQIELRRRARRAVGHLRVRLQRARPRAHLPVLELRRAGPRAQARPQRGRRRRALRHRRSPRWSIREAAVRQLRAAAHAPARCGRYGFYEALDYTPRRLPEGETVAIVRAYMAHHQGMTIVAIANVAARRRDARALPRRADRPGDRAAAAGAHAARRRRRPSARRGGAERAPTCATSCPPVAAPLHTPRTTPRRGRTCCRTAATR